MATWRELITDGLRDGDTFESLIISIDEGELDREFDNGYGLPEGAPFTAWSDSWVYFPEEYDGAEHVGSAPRNPCELKLAHQ